MDEIASIFFVYVMIAAAIGLALYIIISINSIIQLKNSIRKAWANIDVLLKQRHDELPNLVEAVKGYMRHEKKLLMDIAETRSALVSAKSMAEKARIDGEITKTVGRILAVVEDYPTLKANENFKKLQDRITGLENELADRREFYNDAVNNFNTDIQTFPGMLFAKLLKYGPEEFFEASIDERKSKNIKV